MRRLYSSTMSTNPDGTWKWSIESTALGPEGVIDGKSTVVHVAKGHAENFPMALAAMGMALMTDHVSKLEWPPPQPGTESV